MDKMFKNYLSRHWHLTLLVLAISTIALFKHLISGTDWDVVVPALIGAFRAGDVFDTWLNKKQNADLGDHHV